MNGIRNPSLGKESSCVVKMGTVAFVVWLYHKRVSFVYIIDNPSVVLNQIFNPLVRFTLRNIKGWKLRRDLPCGTFPIKGNVLTNMFLLALQFNDLPSFRGVMRSADVKLIV